MPVVRIIKSEVDRLIAGHEAGLFWDTTVKGFGLKVTVNGTASYVVQYRLGGGRAGQTKRLTIGKHGSPWTPDQARDQAKLLLALVAQGQDPAAAKIARREMLTVSQLCDQYLREGTGTKKASTLATDKGRIERHIKPLLGKRKVADVTQADIRKFLKSVAEGATAADVKTKARGRAIVKGGKGTASRTMGLLGGIFSYAIELRLIENNPVHGVKRFPDKKSERFLRPAELSALGEGLRAAEAQGVNSNALNVIKLLVLTGARRGEIERLRWKEVNFAECRLKLEDSKTGQKSIPLNSVALEVLKALQDRAGDQRSYVFPAAKGEGHFTGTSKIWSKLRAKIGLSDVRLHDLRHSFASVGVTGGTPVFIVGRILGHRNVSTTQRYAHLADDPIAAASEMIGEQLQRALQGQEDKSR